MYQHLPSLCIQILTPTLCIVGLERGPLSLVRITEELLECRSSGSGLENREYGSGNPLHSPRNTLYPHKLALTSPTCGGRSVGIVRLRTKTTEFVYFCFHATKTYKSGGLAPAFLTSALDGGQLHDPAALLPRETAASTHWIGGWTGPRAGKDAPAVQHVARRCTD
jgi:hypothetical protein